MKATKCMGHGGMAILMLGYLPVAAATGVLGTPAAGSTVSGVGVISGYHCTSKNIDIYIDGVWLSKAGAGTTLLGTQGVCGRTDTGYSYLYAFNNLSNGQHTISVAADGVIFDQHAVTTFRSGGVPWLSGASKSLKIPDFPQAGTMATIEWVQSYQNFLITNIETTANDLTGLNGHYAQTIEATNVGSYCSYYNLSPGTWRMTAYITVSSAAPAGGTDSLVAYSFTDYDLCAYGLQRVGGDSAGGYSLTGQAVCATNLSAPFPASVSGFKLSSDRKQLRGNLTIEYPGCLQTVTMY